MAITGIGKYNIEIRKYCQWQLVIENDSTPTVTFANYDGAIMQIRSKNNTEIIELSTDNGRIVIDDENETITLTLTSAETTLLSSQEGRYDLLLIDANDEYIPFIEGSANIVEGVTIPELAT